MHWRRFLFISLLLVSASVSAAPKAQYKTAGSKKWISRKASQSKRPPQAAKISKASVSSSPKYRLALPTAPLALSFNEMGRPVLNQVPRFSATADKVTAVTARNEFITYSIDPDLQTLADSLIARARAPHVAAVVMQPQTGKVLAIAEKSSIYPDLSLHAGFPAASLFKVITAAAAVERAGVHPLHMISYRGGTYTLNESNFRPNAKRDQISMSVAEALGRSCNPVFGRLGLENLNPSTLRAYARAFGFNEQMPFEVPLPISTASIPETDYELSRTSAGFGAVTVSPVHAALIMSAIANHGVMPQASLVDRIVAANGKLLYEGRPALLKRAIEADTARTVLQMMEYTTTVGTSKREFAMNKANRLRGMRVAAKTGTLRGDDPHGLNHWFIAAAPLERPRVAIAVIAVDGGSIDSKPSHLGRLLMEKYLLN